MKTAHIITRLIIGGAQENTLFNVDDQHHIHGDVVTLITGPGRGPEGTLEERARERGLDLRVLPELHRNLSPLNDWRALKAIQHVLREFGPDIVHTHSSKAGILGRKAAHSLGLPAVHTIHGASFHYGQNLLLNRAYRAAERVAARWCDHFITVCDAMTDQYVAAGIADRSRFTTIYSGMDVAPFLSPRRSRKEVRAELGFRDDDIVVGKIARLFHLKGHEFLLKAAPEIVRRRPNVRFLLVGDGVLKSEFEATIANAGLTDHFVFTGLVPPDQIAELVHAMDILAHTSEWEGLARVLPQALISGRPVVSFDIDGAREVCIPGETGFLVAPRDSEALVQPIVELAENPRLRQLYGEAGRERFMDQFRHETMTRQIREVYEKVLSQRK